MEVTSTEAMHAANTPHESDDPISAIDEIEGCQSALAETQILVNTGAQRGANGKTSTPEVHHHGMVHGSDSVQTDELNTQLANKSVGRPKERSYRVIRSSKTPDTRLSPSQPMKPYEADQSLEDNGKRSSCKKQAKKKASVASLFYVDNNSSTRRQSKRGDEDRSHVTHARRLPFAPVPASELNIRMGANQTPEKYTPTKTVATPTSLTPVQVASTASGEEGSISPVLSLRQAESLTTHGWTVGDESDVESEYSEEATPVPLGDILVEEDTIESALEKLSLEIYGPDDSCEHHDPDKENVPEMNPPGLGGSQRFNSIGSCRREPLQTLYSAPSPSFCQSPNTFSISMASSQQLHRARYPLDAGRQWQVIVDTECLMNTRSLECIKQLEGIRLTRLIIPSIVIRELGYFQKQEELKARSRSALEWIQSCMLKMPSWIHVQCSADAFRVAITPVSPSVFSRALLSYVGESDVMQPTPHDYVLEYALLQQTMADGRVAILTDNTTLKIKALAEGLVVDSAISFCESLFNPYSDRFVYTGSEPIGRSSGRFCERLHDGISTPRSITWSWTQSRPDSPGPTSRGNFSIWRNSQPVGLQILLA
ncbi:uncharacterized protein [Physcomitrium patens]|uniref:PIN domain-containing protein n=1 Tax=Physcomitrium patens TaxID=3218 RepID=A0A2K1KJ39_PHYPA|nr:FHA domain-containing protein PS1-like [Physcomitrium patens]XP_024376457.1 FHA domain-containing protein PS1-like [Physcomitrium patens]XP_024376458.1 FHA domain-containing protein PS1-like [Physcomitrium patens]XP_024376459.1 FHA domain-containing protein PS1-like [Physcomitrium patens]PNR53783.1 hypothetical protein PHYPA_007458 [Physcomitrium patens]|eukprot:XP_024376456.1 FHA domain-containing protein PS1-like [Physcomitrella patens]